MPFNQYHFYFEMNQEYWMVFFQYRIFIFPGKKSEIWRSIRWLHCPNRPIKNEFIVVSSLLVPDFLYPSLSSIISCIVMYWSSNSCQSQEKIIFKGILQFEDKWRTMFHHTFLSWCHHIQKTIVYIPTKVQSLIPHGLTDISDLL